VFDDNTCIVQNFGGGMNILIVEDETMVAMLVEDMLLDLGHTPVGPASNIASAMAIIDSQTFDAALLDINLGSGEKAFPIADRLTEMGIPYALVSGYDPKGIEGYDHAAKLQKPFSMVSLASTVETLVKQASG
jgi:DNA-binding response OmpR family regulator